METSNSHKENVKSINNSENTFNSLLYVWNRWISGMECDFSHIRFLHSFCIFLINNIAK